MPEHLRALIVILLLAALVFLLARRPAAQLIGVAEFKRRRNLWFALTLLAFFAHSFWIYAAATAILLWLAGKRERNITALFFLMLFLLPADKFQVPGFGVVNFLFDISHTRLVALFLLLPAAAALSRDAGTLRLGRVWPDRLLLAGIAITGVLYLRETTLTDTLRQSFYLYIDVFLPYYVASRGVRQLSEFKDALLSFVLAAALLAIIGSFEHLRHWLLYSAVMDTLGTQANISDYLSRDGSLRAIATTGQAIALGFVISVAIGLYLYLQRHIRSRRLRVLGALLLGAGLVAPLSRGPWIGTLVIIVVFIASGPRAIKRLTLLGLLGVLALPVLALLPGGDKVLNLLPFIGGVDSENITYRQQLIDNAWIVIQRHPWFGSFDYLNTPELLSMMQGGGIIDIVNTYIGLALQVGLVGLSLYLGFFLSVLLGVRKALHSYPDHDDDYRLLGRALLATLLGILVIIFTVSSITVIPIVYCAIAGLGVAYVQMVRQLGPAVVSGPALPALQPGRR